MIEQWTTFYKILEQIPASSQKEAALAFVTKAISRFENLPAPEPHWSHDGASVVLLWSKSHLEFVQVEFHPGGTFSVMVNQTAVEPNVDIFAGIV